VVQLQHAPRTRRKKIGVPASKSDFTEEMLLQTAEDLASGRLKLERVRISDDMCVGLRAVVNRSGRITLHVSYAVGDDRPFKLLGSANKGEPDYISIDDARDLAKTIKALGDRGINVDEANERRLLRELREKGVAWRPGK
jgi:hypothetical protein